MHNDSFWKKLKQPFVGLAPMDGVTDAPFREIVARYGKPDLFFTEFTSVEGICAGAVKPLAAFIHSNKEHPIVAQLFGSTSRCFYDACLLVCELGFDGIDINMGCPAKNIALKGSGAGLIKTPSIAAEIIAACKKASMDFANGKNCLQTTLPQSIKDFALSKKVKKKKNKNPLPVSVKTRIGYEKDTSKEWIGFLLEQKPDAITVHGRTYRQMYGGAADWDAIARAADQAKGSDTLIIGNGDIGSAAHAHETAKKYGVNGILIGRAALGKPWIFNPTAQSDPPVDKIFKIALEHARLHEKLLPQTPFIHMRKHLAWYCRGFPNASDIRIQLMHTTNADEVEKILTSVEKKLHILNAGL